MKEMYALAAFGLGLFLFTISNPVLMLWLLIQLVNWAVF